MLDLTTWRNGNKTKPQPKRLVVGQQLPYHGQQSRWSEREGIRELMADQKKHR